LENSGSKHAQIRFAALAPFQNAGIAEALLRRASPAGLLLLAG
jgi:hypothetical protein